MLRATSAAPRLRAAKLETCWCKVPTSTRCASDSTGTLSAPGMWSSARAAMPAPVRSRLRRPAVTPATTPSETPRCSCHGGNRRGGRGGGRCGRRCGCECACHCGCVASKGRRCGQTLASIFGCACAVGCTRSAWNNSSWSAKPASRNGTRATFSSRARSA